MGSPGHACVLAAPDDPEAARIGRLLDVAVVTGLRGLAARRPRLVLVRLPEAALGRAAAACTLAGVAGAVAVPVGPAARPGWWDRRYARFVLRSQAEVGAWGEAGVDLGRLVVVPASGDAAERDGLLSVLEEVGSMAARPDARRPAR